MNESEILALAEKHGARIHADGPYVDVSLENGAITFDHASELAAFADELIEAAQALAGEPVSVYRLMKKADGVWLPASEFFSGYPDASWEELSSKSPDEWCIQRRVTGKQIADGFAKALSSAPEPAESVVLRGKE